MSDPALTINETLNEVLARPDISSWLRMALLSALDRDPVDAANDAEFLAAVLKARADALLSELQSRSLGDDSESGQQAPRVDRDFTASRAIRPQF